MARYIPSDLTGNSGTGSGLTPEPESVREIPRFLRFGKFYREFVKEFFRIAKLLADMTKKAAPRTKKDPALGKKDFWTPEARRSFQELLTTFTNSLFLAYLDVKRPIRLETDTSGYIISGNLSQEQKTE